MIQTTKTLYHLRILSVKGLFHLVQGIRKHGVNLIGILYFLHKIYEDKKAVEDEGGTLSYSQLFLQSYSKAQRLQLTNDIKSTSKVAIASKNSIETCISIFALSRLGCDVLFINPELSTIQIRQIIEQNKISHLIYESSLNLKSIECGCQLISLDITISDKPSTLYNNLIRQKSGNFSIPTGGTSGKIKMAKRKPSFRSFLHPLNALINQIELHKNSKVYITTPFFHGYGLSAMIVSILLGKEIHIRSKPRAQEILKRVNDENIDVLILVPTILQRLIDNEKGELSSLDKIISGGAPLSPNLANQTHKSLGPILFNLYGTSETGFTILASPKMLQKHPDSIGKSIKGAQLKICNETQPAEIGAIGEMHLRTSWSMTSTHKDYYNTRDLVYQNSEGYLFLKGRSDQMIVSGGENVYPIDLEKTLIQHSEITEVTALAIKDLEFDHRMIAFVSLDLNSSTTAEKDLLEWLNPRVARFQIPARVLVLPTIPHTSAGKPDHKRLRELYSTSVPH